MVAAKGIHYLNKENVDALHFSLFGYNTQQNKK